MPAPAAPNTAAPISGVADALVAVVARQRARHRAHARADQRALAGLAVLLVRQRLLAGREAQERGRHDRKGESFECHLFFPSRAGAARARAGPYGRAPP